MLSKFTRARLISRGGKKVRAHRWIMEQHLGRPLKADEEVHHKNHDPLDNRIENLEVMSRADHMAMHAAEKQVYPDHRVCVACGAEFIVNPRKRSRNKTCSMACAQSMRIAGRKRQAALSRKSLK